MKRPSAAQALAAKTALRMLVLLAGVTRDSPEARRLLTGARQWWSGKKIAVIGPTASGKDSFLARLRGKRIPTVHASSSMGEAVAAFRVRLTLASQQAVDIRCKGVINTGGETAYRDAPGGWLLVCRDADVVFYLMTIKIGRAHV